MYGLYFEHLYTFQHALMDKRKLDLLKSNLPESTSEIAYQYHKHGALACIIMGYFRARYLNLKLKLPLKLQKGNGISDSSDKKQSLMSFNWKTNSKIAW